MTNPPNPKTPERELREILASARGRPYLQAVVNQALRDLPKLHAADQNQIVKVVQGLARNI